MNDAMAWRAVKELTPEFYSLPDFLVNANRWDFGRLQQSGERVDHVQLPPWAHNSPERCVLGGGVIFLGT